MSRVLDWIQGFCAAAACGALQCQVLGLFGFLPGLGWKRLQNSTNGHPGLHPKIWEHFTRKAATRPSNPKCLALKSSPKPSNFECRQSPRVRWRSATRQRPPGATPRAFFGADWKKETYDT